MLECVFFVSGQQTDPRNRVTLSPSKQAQRLLPRAVQQLKSLSGMEMTSHFWHLREWSLSMTRVGAEDIWMGVETK